MSVKSVVKMLPEKAQYPKLMRHKSGAIVLFIDIYRGTVVQQGSEDTGLGSYSEDWTTRVSPTHWEDLKVGESVTLVQE